MEMTDDSSHTAAAPSHFTFTSGLADKYGLGMSGMGLSEPSNHQMQTIEQEFQSYITAPLSNTAETLKFWEVCIQYDVSE